MCTKQYTRWYERELVTPSYLFLLHLFFTIKLANSSKESSSRFSESSTRLKKQLGISFPFLQNICMILFGNYQIYHFRSVFCWIKMDKEKKIFPLSLNCDRVNLKSQMRGSGKVDITICRGSVCTGDDVEDHTISYTITASTRFSDIFQDLIKQKYFPNVSGNDVVWTLFCGNDDLMSWKTEEDRLYSRFVAGEPAILSVKRWAVDPVIRFRYYSSPMKRAQHIFTMFDGSKFHIWHEGFMTEYESYSIPQNIEDKWRKTL